MGLGDWGKFLALLLEKLPIQGRIERIKNQLDRLEQEQKKLLTGDWNECKGEKYANNQLRIIELNRLLRNKASD